jgi:hypothetical protein
VPVNCVASSVHVSTWGCLGEPDAVELDEVPSPYATPDRPKKTTKTIAITAEARTLIFAWLTSILLPVEGSVEMPPIARCAPSYAEKAFSSLRRAVDTRTRSQEV